jgi:hypothetical protein
MDTTSIRRRTSNPAPVGGWALIVGGLAFALFWAGAAASTTFDVDLPWFAGLAVHGISIVTLVTGLVLLALSTLRAPSGRIIAVGAGVAVLGLLMVFPLFPAGLAVVAAGLLRDGWPREVAMTTLVGALGLLALMVWRYVTIGEAIAGDEGAPPLETVPAIAYVVTVVITAAGVVMLGGIRRRGRP